MHKSSRGIKRQDLSSMVFNWLQWWLALTMTRQSIIYPKTGKGKKKKMTRARTSWFRRLLPQYKKSAPAIRYLFTPSAHTLCILATEQCLQWSKQHGSHGDGLLRFPMSNELAISCKGYIHWQPPTLMPSSPTLAFKLRPHSFQKPSVQFSSVQFSCSVMSDSLWPHGRQHTKLPC